MVGEWSETTLGEVVRLQRGHDLPEADRRSGMVPIMGSAGQNGFHDTALANGPGVVIGRSGVGSMGVVTYCATAYWPHNTVLYVTDFLGNDERFTYYFLHHLNLRRFDSGSAQASLNRNYIYPIRVRVPDRSEQRAIAHVLGTLDEKIELNRRMNETLEAMARALFKSWFVDFDPVRAKAGGRDAGVGEPLADLFPDSFEDTDLGEIPKKWEVRSLDEIARFVNGLALQKYPPRDGRSLPVIKIAQLRADSTEASDAASADLDRDYIVEDGDVLFSWSGSLECVLWAGGRGALNQHLFKVTSVQYPKWLYYLWIHQHLEDFRHIAAGKATTMGHIQRHHLSEAKVVVPPARLLTIVDVLFGSLIDGLWHRRVQSRTLAALRDALLPKLISGELRIKDAERLVGEVTWAKDSSTPDTSDIFA